MGFEIITGDVFDCSADALVFPASIFPKVYGLFDEQVYKRAGEQELLKAREIEGALRIGRACITDSFGLKYRYKHLIHIPTPRFSLFPFGTGVQLPRHNSYYSLRICYTNVFELIKKNNLTSVVFPVLGTGEAGYPYKMAKDIAVREIKNYLRRNPQINIILIEYKYQEQYKNFIRTIKLAKELEKHIFPYWHISPDSVIGEHINYLNNILRQEVRTEIDEIYSEYKKEKQKLCEQMENKYPNISRESICQKVNDEIYKEIFKRNQKITNAALAEKIGVCNGSDISKLRNLVSGKGKVYKAAYGFLNNRNNVIFLGKALDLCIDDFCKLLWSRGHAFPFSDFEYDVVMSYIKEKESKEKQINHKEEIDM